MARWRVLCQAISALSGNIVQTLLIVTVLSVATGSLSYAVAASKGPLKAIALLAPDDRSFAIVPNAETQSMTTGDLLALERALPTQVRMNGFCGTKASFSYGHRVIKGFLISDYHATNNDPSIKLYFGRWISSQDDKEGALVGVASQNLLKQLGVDGSIPTVPKVEVEGLPFAIMGGWHTAKAYRTVSTGDGAISLVIPYSVLHARFKNSDNLRLSVDVPPGVSMELVKASVVEVLRKRRRLPQGAQSDFVLWGSEDQRNAFLETTRPFRFTVWMVAIIVGLLALSVTWFLFKLETGRRQREYGIRRAIGATRAQILLQTMIEAAITVGIAIIVGVVLSAFAAWITRHYFASSSKDYYMDYKEYVALSSMDYPVIAFSCALGGMLVALLAHIQVAKSRVPDLLA